MRKPQLVAVDTNILLRLAETHEATVEAWQLISRRLKPVQFLVPPTVLEELANQMLKGANPFIRRTARSALQQMRSQWRFQPFDLNAVSRDSHLLEIDFQKLALLFRQLDLAPPLIASPESLLRKFDT